MDQADKVGAALLFWNLFCNVQPLGNTIYSYVCRLPPFESNSFHILPRLGGRPDNFLEVTYLNQQLLFLILHIFPLFSACSAKIFQNFTLQNIYFTLDGSRASAARSPDFYPWTKTPTFLKSFLILREFFEILWKIQSCSEIYMKCLKSWDRIQ